MANCHFKGFWRIRRFDESNSSSSQKVSFEINKIILISKTVIRYYMQRHSSMQRLLAVNDDDDDFFLWDGWPTNRKDLPTSGSLINVTFQHAEVGIDPGSLKQQSVVLPLHQGATAVNCFLLCHFRVLVIFAELLLILR